MKSRFGSQAGAEALFNEADTDFSGRDAAGDTGSPDAQSGTNPATLNDSPSAGTYTTGSGMTTAQAETLGDGSDEFAEMAFSIDKVTVTAKSTCSKSRVHYGTCSRLKSNPRFRRRNRTCKHLSSEILSEINREVVKNYLLTRKSGCSSKYNYCRYL